MIALARSRAVAAVVAAVALLASASARACAVCYGAADSPIVQGVRAGTLLLLGVIGSVLAAFLGVIVFWARRARALELAAAGDHRPTDRS